MPLTVWSLQWGGGYVWDGTCEVCVDPGHYEWRSESVLVESGHYETATVCPLADALGPDRPLPAGGELFDAAGHAYPVPADGDLVYDAAGHAYRLLAIPADDAAKPIFDAAGNPVPLPPMGPILRDANGAGWRMLLAPVRLERVWIPARYETRDVPIWIEPVYGTRHRRPWDLQLNVEWSLAF